MNIRKNRDNPTPIVIVDGRIDADSYTAFGLALIEEFDAEERFIAIDLSGIVYINSAGLRELVSAARLFRDRDGDVYLVDPSERVSDVLEITGIGSIFTIYPQLDDFIAGMKADPEDQ